MGGRDDKKITSASAAEYFSKNLQQVGFSSPAKAVLTTVKEAVDNALDACEEAGIAPSVLVRVEKLGAGSQKNTEKLRVVVEDNGPGIDERDVARVFGEFLASSKFGRGRCTRGQQGIGISAASTWAQQTSASPVRVLTKTAKSAKAFSCAVDVDLKNNKGVVRDPARVDWQVSSGTRVEFVMDGRVQANGDAGVVTYLRGTALVNPHLTLRYSLPGDEVDVIDRVTDVVPRLPEATPPHPHTMKLGEFISHARLFGDAALAQWLRDGFSRVSEKVVSDLLAAKRLPAALLKKRLSVLTEAELSALYSGLQAADLMAPSTSSVLAVGEEALAKSVERLGDVDYFSVVTRKPTICDFKPVQVEVAIARVKRRDSSDEESCQVLRFANRVPLQFDKASCAIVKAVQTVNWRAYGLRQARDSVPVGPFIIAVSVTSPFIKFKNASKETIDASDELVDEMRRALIAAGQKLSRHLGREARAVELEEKRRHIERFAPIFVETVCRMLSAPAERKRRAMDGLLKILGRDEAAAEEALVVANEKGK